MRLPFVLFRQFMSGARSRAGNVAIIFSLAIVPIVGFVGAALDYSMANANRTSMQKAIDSTALALAKLMPLTQAELDSKGWQIFSANLGSLQVAMPQSGLVITTPTVGKIHLVATGHYTPQISGAIGIHSFPVSVKSEVQWGMKKLELALALDNTGSMASDSKMTELKKAAKNLLTTLSKSAQKQGDVKVSVIPFNTMVNTGQKRTTSWIKKGDWDEKEGSCNKDSWWVTYKTKTDCNYAGGSWSAVTYNDTNFTGCVEDRDKDTNLNYDVLDTTPTGDSSKFPARRCTGNLEPMMPLSYDWTALANKIDGMESNGATNVTIGLVWAWHSLTSNEPLTQAAAASNDLSKYIILMTDGDNTQNRWGGNGSSYCSQCDTRTALACTNVKAAGIKIYTIRVIDGNATLLRNCASDPSMYFDVQNANQLSSVFNSIGATLAQLHLSQ